MRSVRTPLSYIRILQWIPVIHRNIIGNCASYKVLELLLLFMTAYRTIPDPYFMSLVIYWNEPTQEWLLATSHKYTLQGNVDQNYS